MPNIVFGNSAYKYGNTSRLYGVAGSPTTNRLWMVEVDWDGDGYLSGANEAQYTQGIDIDRGFLTEFDKTGTGANHLEGPMVGKCIIDLDNSTGRFNLWTSAGAPSSDILPGRMVKIRTRAGYSGTDAELFHGYIKDITNDPINGTARIVAHDGIEVLQERTARIGALSTTDADYTILQYLHLEKILSNIGWTNGYLYRSPESGGGFVTNIDYFRCNDNAYRVIHDLMKTGEFVFYTNGAGQVVIGTANDFSATDANSYGDDVFLKPLVLSQPWENLYTELHVNTYSYTTQAGGAVLWSKETADTISVAGVSSTDIIVNYRYDDSTITGFFAFPDTLISSTDYVVNTAADGSGSDITSDVTVSLTDFGTSAKLTMTNANASTGYFTTFQIRGTPVTFRKTRREIPLDNWANIGQRILSIDTPFRTRNDASNLDLNGFFWVGYPHLTKRIIARIRARAEQFQNDINDPILLTTTKPVLTYVAGKRVNAFRVMRIRHKWMTDNGQDVETELTLRHALADASSPFSPV